ncbi:MAG: (d)CMP kinase [Actinobacteria bacterium]|uniref:(d)CMP kinase n=1 Tax=freshwater metagenome TaxID=449393 RepID=A0A6J7EKW4_9ZZZZ|nr:(d)CMP kinase [Actinomycetota bacterium]
MVSVVAVDGPAGSGKSSVCRGVATRLGYRYLDTGAMYRAMTWAVLKAGIDPDDAAAVAAYASRPLIASGTDPAAPTIKVDGTDVAEPVRDAAVTDAVSAVSAVPSVRERLVTIQRDQADHAVGAGIGIVVEGRDIGSVVLPAADLKIFLTADAATRALRRAREQAGGAPVGEQSVSATEAALSRRDAFDAGRAASPMTQADDAVVVDTTDLTLAEVIDLVCELVLERAS